jgi:hypothetical protein
MKPTSATNDRGRIRRRDGCSGHLEEQSDMLRWKIGNFRPHRRNRHDRSWLCRVAARGRHRSGQGRAAKWGTSYIDVVINVHLAEIVAEKRFPALFWKVKSRDSVSTALRGRKQLACLAIRFPVAVKARLLGIISAEFVTEELAVCGTPRLQFTVHDCQRLGAEPTSCRRRCGGCKCSLNPHISSND